MMLMKYIMAGVGAGGWGAAEPHNSGNQKEKGFSFFFFFFSPGRGVFMGDVGLVAAIWIYPAALSQTHQGRKEGGICCFQSAPLAGERAKRSIQNDHQPLAYIATYPTLSQITHRSIPCMHWL